MQQIHIKMPTGETRRFDLESDATVGGLKQLIFKQTGIPVEEQKIITGGRVFENDSVISSAGFQRLATIHLVLRSILPQEAIAAPMRAPAAIGSANTGPTGATDGEIASLREQVADLQAKNSSLQNTIDRLMEFIEGIPGLLDRLRDMLPDLSRFFGSSDNSPRNTQ